MELYQLAEPRPKLFNIFFVKMRSMFKYTFLKIGVIAPFFITIPRHSLGEYIETSFVEWMS